MTTENLPYSANGSIDAPSREPAPPQATVSALRNVVFGQHWPLHRYMRDIVAGLGDAPRSGLTYTEQTQIAPDLLRGVLAALGKPAREVAADPQLRGALCDWAQIAAPRLLLVLTGHIDLAVGAILRLGNGSPYQQRCLAELDSAAAMGLLALTELGGTNGANHQTIAEWDADRGGFWLTSPTVASWKFMPNCASAGTGKIAVVTARLLVAGVDQGVLPFLLRLRDSTGATAPGVEINALPDKDSAPMDHGMVRLDHVWVPADGLLGGDWARITGDGRFESPVPVRQRFHRAISVLDEGRLDLANAAIASARAALAGLVNYAGQRWPAGSTRMADRDSVRQDLASGLAAVLATGAFGRQLRDMRAAAAGPEHTHGMWPALAKPLLAYTAQNVLAMCRQRAAAQGALRSNQIVDWIGNVEAIVTAEGESRILWATVGKHPGLTELRLPGTPAAEQLPWYIDMFVERERRLTAALQSGRPDPASPALGPESLAVERAMVTSERLATTALLIQAQAVPDPTARQLATSAAAAYGLDRILRAAQWFADHADLAKVALELRGHRRFLADHMETVVAAFGITTLPGPLFSSNYIHAYRSYTTRAATG